MGLIRLFGVHLSEKAAERAVRELIRRSQWFEVEPMPDGEFAVRVKEENADLLCELSGPSGR